MSIRQITRPLHRLPSTISRELKRNSYKTSINHFLSRYLPNNAQRMADKRRKNFCRKISYGKAPIEYIQNKLTENWSSEQIAHRETRQIENVPSVSSIYRYIHKGQL